MPKMIIAILFLKNNLNIKTDFCKTCILGKQLKMPNQKLSIKTIDKPRVCLYINLFGGKNIL